MVFVDTVPARPYQAPVVAPASEEQGPSPGAQPAAAHTASVQAQEARAAQRGFFLITGAKVWFLLTGTALNIGLPRLLGDPARFGDFGVVNTFISILNMVLITGAVQGVSKRVSEHPEAAWAVRRAGLRLMAWVGGAALVVLLAGADLLARYVFRDPSLAELVRIAAFISFAYGFYAVFIGVFNGLKRFARQALFDISFATLKLGLVLGLVLAGLSVVGALAGFAAAASLIAAAAWIYTARSVPRGSALSGDVAAPGAEPVRLGGFMALVMGYTLLVNFLLGGDVLLLKALSFGPILDAVRHAPDSLATLTRASSAGHAAAALDPAARAAEHTAVLTGLYRATRNVSLISYQAVIAVTFVIFPLVSRATFQRDTAATRTYVGQTLRVAILLVGGVATALAAGGEPLLALLFGDAYAVAAPALLPLLGAMAALALFYVLATILTASGRPRVPLAVAAVAVVAEVAGLLVALPRAAPGAPMLVVAASVTLAANALALVGASVAVARVLRAGLALPTAARVSLASAGALLAVWPLGGEPGHGLGTIFVRLLVAGVVFILALVLTRELTGRDLALARRLLSRGQGAPSETPP